MGCPRARPHAGKPGRRSRCVANPDHQVAQRGTKNSCMPCTVVRSPWKPKHGRDDSGTMRSPMRRQPVPSGLMHIRIKQEEPLNPCVRHGSEYINGHGVGAGMPWACRGCAAACGPPMLAAGPAGPGLFQFNAMPITSEWMQRREYEGVPQKVEVGCFFPMQDESRPPLLSAF